MLSTPLHWSIFGSPAADRILRQDSDWASLLHNIWSSGPHKDKNSCPWVKLARFGDNRTQKNSLRFDENVQEVYGVEGDYDGEKVTPEEAMELLEAANIRAAIYTSPRHTPERPRWRVLAPLSSPHPPQARAALLARINGVLNGILSNESFTLSQSYFFGRVEGSAEYKLIVSFEDPDDGVCVDQLDELDNIAIGRVTHESAVATGEVIERVQDVGNIFSLKVRQLGRKLKEGDGRRDMLMRYIASRSRTGMRGEDLRNMVRGIASAHFEGGIDEKNLDEIIEWANQKDEKRAREVQETVGGLIASLPPLGPDGKVEHPLAKFVDFTLQPTPPKWVIPGFIAQGVVVFAGAHGVGKTTTLLPLSMIAAGLHEDGHGLAPKHWRHVVYIVEDFSQADRIMSGYCGYANVLCKPRFEIDLVRERVHIVEARRLDPKLVAQVGAVYREKFTRNVNGVEIAPLVVIDTQAATLEMENENDNSEASRAIAALKQGFSGLPVWIVGHVAKSNLTRSEAEGLSMRGGSAFEADANQVLFLVKERDDSRWLVRGKTRFEAQWKELQITSHSAELNAADEFGDLQKLTLRWSDVHPPELDRREAKVQAQEQERKDEASELRQEIIDAVQIAHQSGMPLNKAGVRGKVKKKTTTVNNALETLLAENWLFEVHIPSAVRLHPNKRDFLVKLSTTQREEFMATGVIPDELMEIPQSWKKAAPAAQIPSVPKNSESGTDGEDGEG